MKQRFKIDLTDLGTEAMYFSDNDQQYRCIGYLRCDFGHGNEFWTTFFPGEARSKVGRHFSDEFDALINTLRKDMMKSRSDMRRYVRDHPFLPLEGWMDCYGYHMMTNRYEYFIKCKPMEGDYDAYVYAYLREADNG